MKLRTLLTLSSIGILLTTLSTTAQANHLDGGQPVLDQNSISSFTVNNVAQTTNPKFDLNYSRGPETPDGKLCVGPTLPAPAVNYSCSQRNITGLQAVHINDVLQSFNHNPLSTNNAVKITVFTFRTDSCSVNLLQGTTLQKLVSGQAITVDAKTCAVN